MNHERAAPHRIHRKAVVGCAGDAALVTLFAVLGNISHGTGLSPAEIWSTAWPFLLGLGLSWGITGSWRAPQNIWPSGITVVILTVTFGMILREVLTSGSAEASFVIVASVVLGVFLLGRRLLSTLLRRESTAHRATPPSPSETA